MKALNALLLLLLFSAGALSQTVSKSSDAPGVTVVQKKWRAEIRNPALEEDPFRASNERAQEERDQRDNIRENAVRTRLGLPPVPPPNRTPQPETEKRERVSTVYIVYIYEVKVRNDGEKAIRALDWEYVFYEPGTEQEVGRRRFVSKLNISPGKAKSLVIRSASPPTGSINAAKVGKKPRDQYTEQIVINRIEYADGSVWQASSK